MTKPTAAANAAGLLECALTPLNGEILIAFERLTPERREVALELARKLFAARGDANEDAVCAQVFAEARAKMGVQP